MTLIGATTENPYFEVNAALLEPHPALRAPPLTEEDVRTLIDRALADPNGESPTARGDRGGPRADRRPVRRRRADRALGARAGGRDGPRRGREIDLEAAEDALQRKALTYDRDGDRHYDYISAWIKATRASDPDASLYYLAVMLEGGEDPRFIARRMVILASEDVGNADPQALVVATAAAAAVDRVGLPECRLNLAQAAVYLALAPKSNASYVGIGGRRPRSKARRQAPPAHLRDAHYPGAERARARGRLRLSARRAGRRRGPAGDPGGPRGRALLRAHRPRGRGRAGPASGRDQAPARASG